MKNNSQAGGGACREMSLGQGTVVKAAAPKNGVGELLVQVGRELRPALAYPLFSGEIFRGDKVLVNTTALDLGLGSGGMDFILVNLSRPREASLAGPGHIMKLRYTPLQFKSHSLEEAGKNVLSQKKTLEGMVVMVLELHSMILPAAYAIKRSRPHIPLIYIMTDGGSLPLSLSKLTVFMREQGLIDGAITAGNAFGGDLEAVNMYTALLGARHILGAGACIVSMGPGITGTGTPYGFSGIEQGENINRVNILGGKALTCLRMSFAEPRKRHLGVSHHSLTSLRKAALTPATIALPEELEGEQRRMVLEQMDGEGLPGIHAVKWHPVKDVLGGMEDLAWKAASMGRSLADDPLFFASAAAAGKEALAQME